MASTVAYPSFNMTLCNIIQQQTKKNVFRGAKIKVHLGLWNNKSGEVSGELSACMLQVFIEYLIISLIWARRLEVYVCHTCLSYI